MEPQKDATTAKLTRVALVILGLALSILLFYFVLLRESPVFWMNIGGYPLWLRDVVEITYYPLFFLNLGILISLSSLLFSYPPISRTIMWIEAGMISFLWGCFGIIFVMNVANNVCNLMEGRPLHGGHYHAVTYQDWR